VAKKKKASWVGAANPADPETGILKPRIKMNAEQAAEAAKVDPAPKPVSKPAPVQGQKVYKAPVQKRAQKKAAPLIVGGQEVRAPKNSELRRGVTAVSTAPKKKRVKKQKPIAKPVPGQIGKLDGKPVRVTTDNAEKVYDEKRTTVLPTATAEDMTPASRPVVEGVVLPGRLRGSQNKKNLGGFAHSHKVVSSVAHEALGHLQTMAKNEPGTPEHHDAHEAFNVAHAQLGQISNSNFHRFMGMGRTIVTQHRGSNMDTALKVHRQEVLAKLEEGKIAEGSRGDRSGKGGNNGS
jgi:hypothetical protein